MSRPNEIRIIRRLGTTRQQRRRAEREIAAAARRAQPPTRERYAADQEWPDEPA